MNTSSHITTKIFPPINSFFFFFFHIHKTPFSLGKPPWPSLSLFPLSNESFEILCSNQWPPHPSKANENWKWIAIQLSLKWKFLGPMRHKKYSILQSNRMIILMTNGIRGFILPLILDILVRSLEFDPYPFRPLTLTSYFFILITSSN
jgi:hypothetical protein